MLVGRILEDLDALAGNVANDWCQEMKSSDGSPPVLVTAAVDRIRPASTHDMSTVFIEQCLAQCPLCVAVFLTPQKLVWHCCVARGYVGLADYLDRCAEVFHADSCTALVTFALECRNSKIRRSGVNLPLVPSGVPHCAGSSSMLVRMHMHSESKSGEKLLEAGSSTASATREGLN
eukprot:5356468-Amphidinium_carterae.1